MNRREPRITDPLTHPRQDVSPSVAAAFLDNMDDRALKQFLDTRELPWLWRGRRRRIPLSDLLAFTAFRASAGSSARSADHAGIRGTSTEEAAGYRKNHGSTEAHGVGQEATTRGASGSRRGSRRRGS